MALIYETGHNKNVQNLNALIQTCTQFGASYNPPNTTITLVALQNLYTTASQHLDHVQEKLANYSTTITQRKTLFNDLRKTAIRIIAIFEVCGAEDKALSNAKGFLKKINNSSSKAKNTENEENISEASVSRSRKSFDSRVEHLENIIKIVQVSGIYNTNEQDLTLANLITYKDSLKTANQNAFAAELELKNARNQRNQTLYNPKTGLKYTSDLVKKYVKAVFGANSIQHKQVQNINFVRTTAK